MILVEPYKNIKVFFNPETHYFKVVEGKKEFRPSSVTAITGIVDKSGVLMGWAVRMMKEYLVKNWNQEKCRTETEVLELIERASQEHKIKRDVAGAIGTQVHDWVEQFTQGKNPPLPPNAQIQNGINAFLEWVKNKKIKFLEAERIVYSKKYKYAGILDAIAQINGKLVLVDYKTGSGIYPEMILQTAGYQQAYEEETGKKVTARIIAHFDKETGNFEEKELLNHKEDIRGFLSACALSNCIRKLKNNF